MARSPEAVSVDKDPPATGADPGAAGAGPGSAPAGPGSWPTGATVGFGLAAGARPGEAASGAVGSGDGGPVGASVGVAFAAGVSTGASATGPVGGACAEGGESPGFAAAGDGATPVPASAGSGNRASSSCNLSPPTPARVGSIAASRRATATSEVNGCAATVGWVARPTMAARMDSTT